MYIVKAYFEDMLDQHYPYNVGDEYPRSGLSVSQERLADLSSGNNARGVPLIEHVEVEEINEVEEVAETKETKKIKKTGKKKEKVE